MSWWCVKHRCCALYDSLVTTGCAQLRIRGGGRGAGTSAVDVARVGLVSGSERVVMFDIDGGLADLSAFAHLLTGRALLCRIGQPGKFCHGGRVSAG